MNETPSNSEFQPPFEDQAQKNQVIKQSHYRRRDTHIKVYPNPLGRSTQTVFQSSKMDDQHFTKSSGRKDLEPYQQGEQVSDPNGINHDVNGHRPEDLKEIDPNKEVPEDNNYLVDEDGSIIKEPTRELDDPYRPGHADKNNVPPIEKEFPNPNENTKTNF